MFPNLKCNHELENQINVRLTVSRCSFWAAQQELDVAYGVMPKPHLAIEINKRASVSRGHRDSRALRAVHERVIDDRTSTVEKRHSFPQLRILDGSIVQHAELPVECATTARGNSVKCLVDRSNETVHIHVDRSTSDYCGGWGIDNS